MPITVSTGVYTLYVYIRGPAPSAPSSFDANSPNPLHSAVGASLA